MTKFIVTTKRGTYRVRVTARPKTGTFGVSYTDPRGNVTGTVVKTNGAGAVERAARTALLDVVNGSDITSVTKEQD